MLQTPIAPPVHHTTRTDWQGYRHALMRTLYALLLVLVMLLPANFIAAMLSTALYHGNALEGIGYASAHHLAGYWVVAGDRATPVPVEAWWTAAIWDALFWASCASGLGLASLWLGRAVVLRLRPWQVLAAWRRQWALWFA